MSRAPFVLELLVVVGVLTIKMVDFEKLVVASVNVCKQLSRDFAHINETTSTSTSSTSTTTTTDNATTQQQQQQQQ